MEIQTSEATSLEIESSQSSLVSFLAEVPAPLKAAITTFIEDHPNWNHYRLVEAALAGFLVQNGVESREITRLYVDNMFSKNSSKQKL